MKLLDYIYRVFCKKELHKRKEGASKWGFQNDAVEAVLNDFKENRIDKKLIVMPTGGGKTIVGLRVINRMIEEGIITKQKKALWSVHTTYLKSQTESYIEDDKYTRLRRAINLNPEISEYLEIRMNADSLSTLDSSERLNYSMLVIDEAHHAAAKSYKNFFSYNLGIIGLTATPTRLDQKKLPFRGIAYTVKFSTLEKLGVIAMPQRHNISTELTIDSNNLSPQQNLRELAKFDTPKRNKFIADWIFKHRRAYKYKKIVIFTGSVKHALNLYDEIKQTNEMYGQPFEHVGYILGGDKNEDPDNITNEEYLDTEKTRDSSIVINCQVLNEGYDDPNLDTVIMATPSNSTVYYMQCMGRVVRVPEDGTVQENTYIFEFVDKLPNITYRVDNRWLYNEIEQELMPKILDDVYFESYNDLKNKIKTLFKANAVDIQYLDSVLDIKGNEFGILMFTDSGNPSNSTWFPMLLDDSEAGKAYKLAFNQLSFSIDKYAHYGYGEAVNDYDDKYIAFTKLGIKESDSLFRQPRYRSTFIYAMARAFYLKSVHQSTDCIKYVSFRKKMATVTYDDQTCTPAKLASAVTEMGFPAKPATR